VSELVTHEPFTRVNRRSLIRDFKNDAIAELIKGNTDLQSNSMKALLKNRSDISGAELANIIANNSNLVNTDLRKVLSQLRVPNDAANVLKTIENLTGVESNLKLNVASLKNLRVQKDAIESAIKNTLTNIIKSKIAGAVQEGLNNIKKYF
jgi:hypothetical protein